jgi:phosphoribosylformylglycinamidine cyclo-ligase
MPKTTKSKSTKATYKKAGVDIEAGDSASSKAYKAALSTHVGRKGMFGAPIKLEGGFTGALDCGDFYLVQNDDGVGSKSLVAEKMNKYDTLGYDLLAMVTDDAICVGAEVVSITNTIDINKVNEKVIGKMMEGLAKACLEQNVVVMGGEIAELRDQVKNMTWNAAALGIIEKQKFITGMHVRPGDKIIGLKSRGFRSNGFSLVRHILKKEFGEDWHRKKFNGSNSWGAATLTPSRIYHACVLDMIGRFKKETARVHPKAVIHNTGGGLPGNLNRILKKVERGAVIENAFAPHQTMLSLQKMGGVEDEEAYKTWNMGIGLMIIVDESQASEVISIARKHSIPAQVMGEVTSKPGISVVSQGYFQRGRTLEFE